MGDELYGWNEKGYQYLAEQTFKFLKKCLKMVDPSMPFRGPKYYKEGNFEYFNKVEGDVTRFSGLERIKLATIYQVKS